MSKRQNIGSEKIYVNEDQAIFDELSEPASKPVCKLVSYVAATSSEQMSYFITCNRSDRCFAY